MKNGTIHIKTFLLLDRIREKHSVLDATWAERAGLGFPTRISELRAMAEGRREVLDRAFHYRKFVALAHALQSIIGDDVVRKELTELLEKAVDKDEKLILLISTLAEDRKEQAIAYLELLNQVPEKKGK